MSQSASPRRRSVLRGTVVLVVVAAVTIAVWRLGGGEEDAAPPAAAPRVTTPAPSSSPTPAEAMTSTPTPTPTPTPSGDAPCEGPDTAFNEEGIEQDSLLPDCGVAPVTQTEQNTRGLSLACGGSYPVILYKTTTSGARTSICGRDTSGVDFRFVTQPQGGDVVDLKGDYDGQLDAFTAKDGGTSYLVQAYDGTLVVERGGKKTKQTSSDWISLDNEPDTD